MKNAFLLVVGLCFCAGSVSADYANPPGWDDNPYFTHQSWSFGDNTNPSNPDDGGAGNPYGTASFNLGASGTWVDDLGMVYDPSFNPLGQRQGGWRVDGPSGIRDEVREDWFTIDIPNIENPNLTKEVWIELTFMVTNMGHAGTISDDVDLQVWADGIIDDDYKFDYHGADEAGIGGSAMGEIWVRSASTFSFFPQPGDELITLSGWLDDGFYVVLDQIDVDTRCTPEPATLSLLGVGVLALVRRRKNR
jgi:hypothetical protein